MAASCRVAGRRFVAVWVCCSAVPAQCKWLRPAYPCLGALHCAPWHSREELQFTVYISEAGRSLLSRRLLQQQQLLCRNSTNLDPIDSLCGVSLFWNSPAWLSLTRTRAPACDSNHLTIARQNPLPPKTQQAPSYENQLATPARHCLLQTLPDAALNDSVLFAALQHRFCCPRCLPRTSQA